jgi:hypothetical protein
MRNLPLGYFLYRVPIYSIRKGKILSMFVRSYNLIFGVSDLHSHIRYRCLRKSVQNVLTLDVGGDGG